MKITPRVIHEVRKINYLCDNNIYFLFIKKSVENYDYRKIVVWMQRKHHKIKIILLVIWEAVCCFFSLLLNKWLSVLRTRSLWNSLSDMLFEIDIYIYIAKGIGRINIFYKGLKGQPKMLKGLMNPYKICTYFKWPQFPFILFSIPRLTFYDTLNFSMYNLCCFYMFCFKLPFFMFQKQIKISFPDIFRLILRTSFCFVWWKYW